MGQGQSRPSSSTQPRASRSSGPEWWDTVRFAAVTAAVAAVQWFRYTLVAIEDGHPHQRHHHDHRHARRRQGEGFAGKLSPDTRRALVNLIDYQLTPVLVDQWR